MFRDKGVAEQVTFAGTSSRGSQDLFSLGMVICQTSVSARTLTVPSEK